MNNSLKSTRPRTRPIGGMRISFTSDVTIFPNAAPITIPTARSRTFPRTANSLNSLNMIVSIVAVIDRPKEAGGNQVPLLGRNFPAEGAQGGGKSSPPGCFYIDDAGRYTQVLGFPGLLS